MATALINFLNRISTNQIRTQNMFELQVNSGYSEVDSVLKDITMYGEGFEIPTRTQEFVNVPFKGFDVPVPSVMKMGQDHTVTIRADVDGQIRRAFLAWQGKVADPAISDGSVFAGDRRVNNSSIIRVILLDNNMADVTEVYKMIGVKINEVGPMTVTNTGGEVATFTVSFKSVYWEIETSKHGALIGQR